MVDPDQRSERLPRAAPLAPGQGIQDCEGSHRLPGKLDGCRPPPRRGTGSTTQREAQRIAAFVRLQVGSGCQNAFSKPAMAGYSRSSPKVVSDRAG